MRRLAFLTAVLFACSPAGLEARRPNILLILTDDQGWGDLGCHGNPKIRTPNLDVLARQSVRLERFYVSPVCTPTRASLLTGRYNFRTGAIDTYLGRALMHPDETTLAEMLRSAGYRTAIFGKWHLGDNYPLRSIDQGFEEALVIKGGGLVQPSDPPGGDSYFDPTLYHNGKAVKSKGYCSEIFAAAASQYIAAHREESFFAYLAFNAPHAPLQVPDSYLQLYKDAGLPENTARVYAMVTNIDDQVGRLLARLDELQLAQDTIVIFMTDNGPAHERWNGGMRGNKGTVFEGGIRVPFYIRWPAALEAGRRVDSIAAHIDLAPTLLEACGVKPPDQVSFDGKSLLPLLLGKKVDWPDRTLYFQWHRGDAPELFRACAARTQRFKMTRLEPQEPPLLFDLQADPEEKNDLAAREPQALERLLKGYEAWFRDVSSTRGYDPPRIHLGSPHENPVVLTRQDWRGPRANWKPEGLGHWEVEVERAGSYEIRLRFKAPEKAGKVRFSLGGAAVEKGLEAGTSSLILSGVQLPAGPGRLEAVISAGESAYGPDHVEVNMARPGASPR